MNPNDQELTTSVTEQAASWFVANDDAPLDEQHAKALAAWLRQSPRHVEEFLGVSAIARDLRSACSAAEFSAESLLARSRAEDESSVVPLRSRFSAALGDNPLRRWQTVGLSLAAALGIVTLGVVWLLRPAAPVSSPAVVNMLHFETRHGELQNHKLEDGSVLRLSSDTAVTIRYSKTERLVSLTSGEAEFEVVHAVDRPFRVQAGPAMIVDLGTRFDVRLEDKSTVVTVVEGRVAVGHSPAASAGSASPNAARATDMVYLGTDQQLRVTENEWPATPSSVDARRTTAWLHRQIVFDREPLDRVAGEFNRYVSKPIEISSPELRTLQISGVFSIDNSAAFIAFLRSLDGVQVDVTDERVVVSRK